jgi:hypothetical protein
MEIHFRISSEKSSSGIKALLHFRYATGQYADVPDQQSHSITDHYGTHPVNDHEFFIKVNNKNREKEVEKDQEYEGHELLR